MKGRALLLAMLAALPASGAAQDENVVVDQRAPEEIIIFGDPFARWDGTRWFVHTQVGLPLPYPMFAEFNKEFEPTDFDIRMITACEKTWRRTKKRYEVDCKIEDISLRAATYKSHEPNAQAILEEFDEKLSKAKFQLVVADDGRVLRVDLSGLPTDNARQNAINEQARMLLNRAMAGFHMRLPPQSQIRLGQWVEYDSSLFSIPIVNDNQQERRMQEGRAPIIQNTMAGSHIIHQLDKYKGHLIVQSVGKGTIHVSNSDEERQSYFTTKLNGVAIYDDKTGIMTERVWSVQGVASAGSYLGEGRSEPRYFHVGKLRQLEDDDTPAVGETMRVANPGQTVSPYPLWEELE